LDMNFSKFSIVRLQKKNAECEALEKHAFELQEKNLDYEKNHRILRTSLKKRRSDQMDLSLMLQKAEETIRQHELLRLRKDTYFSTDCRPLTFFNRIRTEKEWEQRLLTVEAMSKQDVTDAHLERTSLSAKLKRSMQESALLRDQIRELSSQLDYANKSLEKRKPLPNVTDAPPVSPLPTLMRVNAEQTKQYDALQQVRF